MSSTSNPKVTIIDEDGTPVGVGNNGLKVDIGDNISVTTTVEDIITVDNITACNTGAIAGSVSITGTPNVAITSGVQTDSLTDTQLRATAVPISGTVTANTGLTTQTDALTDTQLRATAVPISGTVNTGLTTQTDALTDTQLRATAVPISGTVNTGLTTQTDSLTDTQLRATAVPVSGTVAVNVISGFATSEGQLAAGHTVDCDGTDVTVDNAIDDAVYARITNGTQVMPTMDAAARSGFVRIVGHDGINQQPAMDIATRRGYVAITNGTQVMPMMDHADRAGYVTLTNPFDGSVTLPADTFVVEGGALGKGVLLQGDDGSDRQNLACTTNGQLDIRQVAVNYTSGGTAPYQQDAVGYYGGTIGIPTKVVRSDSVSTLTSVDDGDWTSLQVDEEGSLYTTHGVTGMTQGITTVGVSAMQLDEGTDGYPIQCKHVDLMSRHDNTGIIYVGSADTIAADGSVGGIRLDPGDFYSMDINNLNHIWVEASAADQELVFIYYT